MALWILNPGADCAELMLERSVVGIVWPELPDLACMAEREQLAAQYRRCFPEARGARLVRDIGQIHSFAHHARPGDLVLVPLRGATPIAVGEIVGDYSYRSDAAGPLAHTRAVRWIDDEMALGDFEEELRGSLETSLWFCRVQRRGLEDDLRRQLEDRQSDSHRADTSRVDWLARRQIMARLEELAEADRLPTIIDAVLELRGLLPRIAPDGDSRGDLLFVSSDDPSVVRLQLVVRTDEGPIEERDLHEFAARVEKQGADQGLMVAWSGLSTAPRGAMPEIPSSVRIWSRDDVLEALLTVYERLPRELQGEIPLKRIWTLDGFNARFRRSNLLRGGRRGSAR